MDECALPSKCPSYMRNLKQCKGPQILQQENLENHGPLRSKKLTLNRSIVKAMIAWCQLKGTGSIIYQCPININSEDTSQVTLFITDR